MKAWTAFALLSVGRAGWAAEVTYDCADGGRLQDAIDALEPEGGTVTVACDGVQMHQELVTVEGYRVGPVAITVAEGTDFTLVPASEYEPAIILTDGGSLQLSNFTVACPTEGWIQDESLVYADSASLTLSGMTLKSCALTGDLHGAAVAARSGTTLVVDNTTFVGSTEGAHLGGAIYASQAFGAITHSTFYGAAAVIGGAIWCTSGVDPLIIHNNLFVATATTQAASLGQFLYSESCALSLQNNVFLYEEGAPDVEAIAISDDAGTALANNLFLGIARPVLTDAGFTLSADTNACDVERACVGLDNPFRISNFRLQSVDIRLGDLGSVSYPIWPTMDSPLRNAGTFPYGLSCGRPDIGLTGGEYGEDGPAWWPDVDNDGSGDADDDCWPELYECDDHDAAVSGPEARFADEDGDGFGEGEPTEACPSTPGTADSPSDCDDADPTIHPTATEICDAVDDNCDGHIDEELPTFVYYPDADGDGYGEDLPFESCAEAPPEGAVGQAGDCDDADDRVHPGAEEKADRWQDLDQDCDGRVNPALHGCALVGPRDLLSPCILAMLLWTLRRAPGGRRRGRVAKPVALVALLSVASTAFADTAQQVLADAREAERRCHFVDPLDALELALADPGLDAATHGALALVRQRLIVREWIQRRAYGQAYVALGELGPLAGFSSEDQAWADAQRARVRAEEASRKGDASAVSQARGDYVRLIALAGPEPACATPAWAGGNVPTFALTISVAPGATWRGQASAPGYSALPATDRVGPGFGGGLALEAARGRAFYAEGRGRVLASETVAGGGELGIGLRRGALRATVGPALWVLPCWFQQGFDRDHDGVILYRSPPCTASAALGNLALGWVPGTLPWSARLAVGVGAPQAARAELAGAWMGGAGSWRPSLRTALWWSQAQVSLEGAKNTALARDLGAVFEVGMGWRSGQTNKEEGR